MSGNKALSTWSGYDHQGIVALIVGIDKIQECLGLGTSIDNLYLGIERDEDFEIGEVGISVPLESHQVKAYADSKHYSSYKGAVENLEEGQANGKYLHSMIAIEDWPHDSNYCVKRYEYSTGVYHFGQEIFSSLVGRVASITSPSNTIKNELIAKNLMSRLTLAVCKEHAEKRKVNLFDLKIPLKKIHEWIIGGVEIKHAQLFEIKERLWKDSQAFFSSSLFTNSPDEVKGQLIDFVHDVNALDMARLQTLLELLNPHSQNRSMTTDEYYTKSGWQDVCLEILTRVVNTGYEVRDGGLPLYSKLDQWYAPSLICNENDHGDEISSAIQKNISAARICYEANVIITKGIEKDVPIPSSITRPDNLEEGFDFPGGLSSGTRITRPKNVRLSSRDKSIQELNS